LCRVLVLITEFELVGGCPPLVDNQTHRIQLVLFGMKNRTLRPYLACAHTRRCVRCIPLTSLNPTRLQILLEAFLEAAPATHSSAGPTMPRLPTPAEVAAAESIFPWLGHHRSHPPPKKKHTRARAHNINEIACAVGRVGHNSRTWKMNVQEDIWKLCGSHAQGFLPQ
jgi:hypothetical protein